MKRAATSRPWPSVCALLLAAGCEVLPTYTVEPSQRVDAAVSVCKRGAYRCAAELLYACSADRSEWAFVADCGEPGRCDSVAGSCIECEQGSHRCDGPNLESCRGTTWAASERCASADECNVASGACQPCTEGARQCSGADQAELERCDADHRWQVVDRCPTRELCLASVAAPAPDGGCQMPACPEPGSYRCDEAAGTHLLRCPSSLLGWSEVDVCASRALCERSARDAEDADAGEHRCLPPQCPEAGARRCRGATVERCNEDLTAWLPLETCKAPLACNPASGACAAPCDSAAVACNDAELQECTGDRTWRTLDTCLNAALCSLTEIDDGARTCAGPRCAPPFAYRCSDAVLEQCDALQAGWKRSADCGSASLCNDRDGRCDSAVCRSGQLRCSPEDPRVLEGCDERQSGWEAVTTCAEGEACNLSRDEPCIQQPGASR